MMSWWEDEFDRLSKLLSFSFAVVSSRTMIS
jgi:hypothetical protein